MAHRTEFRVIVKETAVGERVVVDEPGIRGIESAIRLWDQTTWELGHKIPSVGYSGGIEVKQWDAEGNCIRDGWVLHVWDGQTYLNPNLVLKGA